VERIGLRTPAFVLTPHLFALAIIGIGFSVFIIGMTALRQIAPESSEPFSIYADIFPGQPESAAQQRGFSCYYMDDDNFSPAPRAKHCLFHPDTGAFSSIDVTISSGTIRQISFIMRDNAVRVGDLALFFGTRDFRRLPRAAFFTWDGKLGMASIVGGGKFSLFRHVWQVTFTNTPFS